jgi:hypothetical protein
VQVVFLDALEAEGLLELLEARQDAPASDPFPFDAAVDVLPPVLLAVSDNGPQMTTCSTREFMAMCAIAQHFGRPGTPTDQAWIESLFSHIKADWPHLDRIPDPPLYAPSTPSSATNTTRSGCTPRSGTSPPPTSTTAAGPRIRAPANADPDTPAGPASQPSTTESQSQPPQPHQCGPIRSPTRGFDSDTPHIADSFAQRHAE